MHHRARKHSLTDLRAAGLDGEGKDALAAQARVTNKRKILGNIAFPPTLKAIRIVVQGFRAGRQAAIGIYFRREEEHVGKSYYPIRYKI